MLPTVSTPPRTPFPVVIRGVIVALVALVLAFVYRHYSLGYATNSDYADILLEGDSMFHGNTLLSHWYLTTVSWYTTDVVLFAIGVAIRGFHPVLLHEVPVVVYTALLFAAMYLASGKRLRHIEHGWRGIFLVFVLIGMPMEAMGAHLMLGAFRMGTTLLALLGYMCIDRCGDEKETVSPIRIALFGILLAIALVADNFPIYTVVLPVLLTSLWRGWRNPALRSTEIGIAGAAIAAVLLAKICLRGMTAAGGFIIPDSYASHIQLIAIENLWRNTWWTVEGLQVLFRCDFWGLEAGPRIVPVFGRLVLPALIFYGMIIALKPFVRKEAFAASTPAGEQPLTDRVSLYLALGMGINLLAYLLTSLAIGLEATRYLVPFAIFGAVLIGRYVSRDTIAGRENNRRLAVYAAIAGMVLAAPPFLACALRAPADSPARRLGETLKAQNLTDGYGAYWCGTDVVVQSRNQVRVRAIIMGDKGLQPFLFGADERWYKEGTPANFVVLDQRNFGGVTAESVTKAFGKPSRTFQQEGYTVLVYDHDIASGLQNKPVIRN